MLATKGHEAELADGDRRFDASLWRPCARRCVCIGWQRQRREDVEHTQPLLVEDIPRFARLGVVASMQPFPKADDGRYAEKRLGAERLKGSYAFRRLVDAGVLVCFGNDFPVVTLNPFSGIDAAVNARTLAGKIWLPAHSLTLEEALRAYTVSGPKAIHARIASARWKSANSPKS